MVWREQGLGDELLFLTCCPDLIAAGAQLTVLVSPRLVGMVQRAFPAARVLPDQADGIGLGEFDWQVGMGSLPRHLRRTRRAFPADGAILTPEAGQRRKWAERLVTLGTAPKIGLCWRSGLVTPERVRHYPPVESLGPLFAIPGVIWINLQYDECATELDAIEARWGVQVRRWPEEDLKNDLESVIGLLAALDAVVTAPTAVSSLSGAVGVRTWQMDSGSDWTTFGEARSPWFPSIEILTKRPSEGGWGQVVDEIRSAVEGLKVSGRIADN